MTRNCSNSFYRLFFESSLLIMMFIIPSFNFEKPKKCSMYQISKLYYNFFKDSTDNLFLQEIKTIIRSNYEGVILSLGLYFKNVLFKIIELLSKLSERQTLKITRIRLKTYFFFNQDYYQFTHKNQPCHGEKKQTWINITKFCTDFEI